MLGVIVEELASHDPNSVGNSNSNSYFRRIKVLLIILVNNNNIHSDQIAIVLQSSHIFQLLYILLTPSRLK